MLLGGIKLCRQFLCYYNPAMPALPAPPLLSRRSILYALLFLPWLALLGWLVSLSWFLTDDAFISFRYARNLLDGYGLVFNPGERVEGYTNFLWVLELATLWGLFGWRPEYAAPWLSVVCTAATLALLLYWVARMPGLRRRALTAWLALGLVASSATFAVWTSAGGLETRQFTMFIVAAVVSLALHRSRRWGLLAASFSLAGAALTRPEGLLIAAICFSWFIGQRMLDALPSLDGRGVAAAGIVWRLIKRLNWREITYLVAPFVLLIAGHFLFRYAYYGEWLPNTYYAKFVRPWWEAGVPYYAAAALETGLYLLLQLAVVAAWRHWRRERDSLYILPLLLIVSHALYVMRVGGDYFEWRPLDFYWPLLAAPAAAGIVYLGEKLAAGWRRLGSVRTVPWRPGVTVCALLIFIPTLFYAGAMQGALLLGTGLGGFDRSRVSWYLSPSLGLLTDWNEELRYGIGRQAVGQRFDAHRERARGLIEQFQPYEAALPGVIPADALMTTKTLGIMPFYVPELRIVDYFGLADKVIARNPVSTPNAFRGIAHDRKPPPGYLRERGVNFTLYPPTATEAAALERALYAIPVGPQRWLPFDALDYQWVKAHFAQHGLAARFDLDTVSPKDYIRDWVGDRQPIIRGNYAVYRVDNRLIYVKEPCSYADAEARFFLHLVPVSQADLPPERQQYGVDNLDFNLMSLGRLDAGLIADQQLCAAARELPDYPIAEIRTGQFVPEVGTVWEQRLAVAE